MEDTKVSYETALLAKGKGFNEKCTHYYVLDFSTFKSNGIPKQHRTPIEDNENILQLVRITEHQPHLASAPSQSLLQKWLREKYNIHIQITTDDGDDFGMCLNIIGNEDKSGYWTYFHKTYEQALEEGLKQGLKLI